MRAGLQRAEQGLTGLLGFPVRIRVEEVALQPVLAAGLEPGPAEQDVVGVYVGFGGDLTGHCLLCLGEASAAELAGQLLGGGPWEADLVDSALLEFGNIAVSSAVNGLADAGGWEIRVTPPVLGRDMLGALVNTVLAAASLAAAELLAVRAQFRCAGSEIAGTLLLLPDAASLRFLLATGRGRD